MLPLASSFQAWICFLAGFCWGELHFVVLGCPQNPHLNLACGMAYTNKFFIPFEMEMHIKRLNHAHAANK